MRTFIYFLILAGALAQPAWAAPKPGDSALRVETDVAYLGADRKEKLDIYIPTTGGDRLPCLVIIHGGGWGRGDKAEFPFNVAARDYAAQGYVVASINYYLVPEEEKQRRQAHPDEKVCYFDNLFITWPRNIHDCKTAIRFLRKNAANYRIDPDHIGVLGCSAGAQLAAVVGTAQPAAGLEPKNDDLGDVSSAVKCVVGLYGIYDWPSWSKGTNRGAAINTDEKKAVARTASAVTHVDPQDPPMLLLHGTADRTVSFQQSETMAAKLKAAGVLHQYVPFEGVDHSFFHKPADKNKGDTKVILEFLDKHLKGDSSPGKSATPRVP
jgi:acetyl esterase/lipase